MPKRLPKGSLWGAGGGSKLNLFSTLVLPGCQHGPQDPQGSMFDAFLINFGSLLVAKVPKKSEHSVLCLNIVGQKIGATVTEKGQTFRNIFKTCLVWKSEARYQKKQASIVSFFFLHFWGQNRRHGTHKKGGHSVCFLFYVFGWKIGGMVPKKRRVTSNKK